MVFIVCLLRLFDYFMRVYSKCMFCFSDVEVVCNEVALPVFAH